MNLKLIQVLLDDPENARRVNMGAFGSMRAPGFGNRPFDDASIHSIHITQLARG